MTELQVACGVCGWPGDGRQSCGACGMPGDQELLPCQDAVGTGIGGTRPQDYPQLAQAFTAWAQKDWTRMVGQCLRSLGVEAPQITRLPVGPGWSFSNESAAIYLSVHLKRAELSIESPMILLPEKRRVPLLRNLLEMNDHSLGASRFCLRERLVVLRFADRMENLSPPKLAEAVTEVAVLANRFDDLLAEMFGATMVGWDAQARGLDWSVLGKPRRLSPYPEPNASSPRPGATPRLTPHPSPQPDREVEGQELDGREGLCALLRQGLALTQELDPGPESIRDVVLLQRALVFRALDQFRDSAPDAVALLVSQGLALGDENGRGLFTRNEPSDPSGLDLLLQQIVEKGGFVDPQAPVDVERFSSAREAKNEIRRLVECVESGPRLVAFRHFVLVGVLSEAQVRTRLPAKTAGRVREAILKGRHAAPTPDTVDQLLCFLRELAS